MLAFFSEHFIIYSDRFISNSIKIIVSTFRITEKSVVINEDTVFIIIYDYFFSSFGDCYAGCCTFPKWLRYNEECGDFLLTENTPLSNSLQNNSFTQTYYNCKDLFQFNYLCPILFYFGPIYFQLSLYWKTLQSKYKSWKLELDPHL